LNSLYLDTAAGGVGAGQTGVSRSPLIVLRTVNADPNFTLNPDNVLLTTQPLMNSGAAKLATVRAAAANAKRLALSPIVSIRRLALRLSTRWTKIPLII